VTEGTTNNVYTVFNGEVWTAPLSVGILQGITRDWIFEVCKRENIPIQERLFTGSDLQKSDEMFLSSSTKEVMPITKLSGQLINSGNPGPITGKLHQALKNLIAEYCQKY